LYSNDIFELTNKSFPLSISKNIRSNLINKNIANEKILEAYIDTTCNDVIKDITFLDNENEDDKYNRKNKYIYIKWYISSLIERINYISSNTNLEMALPYFDYRIVEYIYNMPNQNEENDLLKKIYNKIYKNDLPVPNKITEINYVDYITTLEHEIKKILNDSESKLLKIIDKDYVLQILNLKGTNLSINKEDELISYRQILAYLIQIEYWLNIYDIELEI